MNKAELIDLISNEADISRASATRALDATLNGIAAALRDGEQVSLTGFGTFNIKERAQRQGRNPQTGAAITIAANRLPGFKPGKALRDAVN